MSSVPAGEILDRAVITRIGEVEVKVVSYEDLIAAKREAGRPKDRIDLDELKRQNEDA